MKKLFICAVLVLFAAGTGFSQDVAKQEAQKARLEKEIAVIEQQLKDNASKSGRLLADQELIRTNISKRKALVQVADRHVRLYADSIYLIQKEISRLQVRVDTLTEHYSRLVLSAYKNRDSRVWYMYIFASENLGQAFRRFGYFRNLSAQMKAENLKIKSMQSELEEKKAQLSSVKEEEEAVKTERLAELDRLKSDEAKAASMMKKLNREKAKYKKEIEARKKEVAALNREIKKRIDEAMKKEKSKESVAGKEENIALAKEFSKNRGKLPWPAEGTILRHFGDNRHPVFKNIETPECEGVEVLLKPGAPVSSVFGGVVTTVEKQIGYNYFVIIKHGSYFTVYCGLKTVRVKEGDKVNVGNMLGEVYTMNGQTRLLFEVRTEKGPLDPEDWLRSNH